MNEDRVSMAYWWPKLQATKVPVPETQLLQLRDVEHAAITKVGLDEGSPDDRMVFQSVVSRLKLLAASLPAVPPVFLRTGHGSGKHEWPSTCYVADLTTLGQHVYKLIEWSHLVDMFGLPCDVWVVRELLEVDWAFKAFRGLPISRERRVFIEGGKVLCHHPYWPPAAINGNGAPRGWAQMLARVNREQYDEALVRERSELVSTAFAGAWSLDWLYAARRGVGTGRADEWDWYAIDMAPAERSWHWPGCPVAAERWPS